jgi:hypothetical protein
MSLRDTFRNLFKESPPEKAPPGTIGMSWIDGKYWYIDEFGFKRYGYVWIQGTELHFMNGNKVEASIEFSEEIE